MDYSRIVQVLPPTIEIITYEEAIDHLRMGSFDESVDLSSQDYINRLITLVRKNLEKYLGRAFITQSFKYYLDKFPPENYIPIPYPPFQLTPVPTLKYTDYNGTQTTWASTNYILDAISQPGRIVLTYGNFWPTNSLYPSNPIEISYTAGYGAISSLVPESIRQAALVYLTDLWENRQNLVTPPKPEDIKLVENLVGNLIVWEFDTK